MSDSSTQRPQKPLELILACNLLTSISIPAFLVDNRGLLLFYNEAAGTLLGIPFEEAGRMEAQEWGTRFGPIGSNGEPIPFDQLPLVIALREGDPPTRTFASTRPRARSTTSRSARSRSPPRRSRARSRSSGRGTTTARTAGTTNEGQGVGRARVGSGARTRDEPLRRQHVVRGGDAVGLRDADPRRGNRDPHARLRPGHGGCPTSTSCSRTSISTTSRG